MFAEFWNTLTSLVYIIPGLLNYMKLQQLKCSKNADTDSLLIRRLQIMTLSWVLLGAGSFVFHATQSGWGELLDELGMISVSASTCYALRDFHPLTTGNIGLLFYVLYFKVIGLCMGLYLVSGSHPFFSIVFIASSLVSVYLMGTAPSKRSEMQTEKLREGVFYALLGYGIWHIDQACVAGDWLPSYRSYEWELQYWSHPIWHILTSIAGHSFIAAVVFGILQIDISRVNIYAFNNSSVVGPAIGIPMPTEHSRS